MATMKALENVLSQVDRIRRIASRWSATETVSDMERELMLDKLRALYEEVLFLDWEQTDEAQQEVMETAAAAVAGGADMLPDATSAEMPGVTPPDTNMEAAPEPEIAPVPAVPGDEIAEEPLPTADEQSPVRDEAATVVWAQQTVTTVSETSDQKLFSDEPHVRTRVDKQVILSLYGEGTPASSPRSFSGAHQPAAQPAEISYEPEIGAEPAPVEPVAAPVEPVTAPAERVETPVESAAAPEAAPREMHIPVTPQNGHGPKVLGEIIAAPSESLGDRLGKQHSHADVASRLRASTITDLQHSIGINDRFLLINELFGGDAARYEQTLARLNEFTALDDAMIYIQENFDWNPDGEGAAFLVELLERKLEN